MFPARDVRATLLEEDCVPCSSGLSNTARDVRMPLLEGFESPYLMVLDRSI